MLVCSKSLSACCGWRVNGGWMGMHMHHENFDSFIGWGHLISKGWTKTSLGVYHTKFGVKLTRNSDFQAA